jgi:glycerol uptake facilitator-like aquaporin
VSRPASFNPLISLIAEALMTFIFLFLVNMMTARGQYLYQPSYGMYSNIVLPILIGFVICSMILATGPTGFAGNPARDLVSVARMARAWRALFGGAARAPLSEGCCSDAGGR